MPKTQLRRLRASQIAAGIALITLVVSGCAPGETAEPAPTESEEAAGISTEVPSDVDITLTLATWEVGGLNESIKAIAEAYEAKHPTRRPGGSTMRASSSRTVWSTAVCRYQLVFGEQHQHTADRHTE